MHPKHVIPALQQGARTPGERAAVVLIEHYAHGALLRSQQLAARITNTPDGAHVDWPKLAGDLTPLSGRLDTLPPGGRAALRIALALATNGPVPDFADTLARVDSTVLRALAYAVSDEPDGPGLPAPDPESPLYAATLHARQHAA